MLIRGFASLKSPTYAVGWVNHAGKQTGRDLLEILTQAPLCLRSTHFKVAPWKQNVIGTKIGWKNAFLEPEKYTSPSLERTSWTYLGRINRLGQKRRSLAYPFAVPLTWEADACQNPWRIGTHKGTIMIKHDIKIFILQIGKVLHILHAYGWHLENCLKSGFSSARNFRIKCACKKELLARA